MSLRFATSRSVPASTGLVAVAVFSDGDRPDGVDEAELTARGFEGTTGQVQIVAGASGTPVALVGLGATDEFEVDSLRRIGAALARAARRTPHLASMVLDGLPEGHDAAAAAQAFGEGLILGAYEYTELKSDPTKAELIKVTHLGGGGKTITRALERAKAIADAVCFARDLVNEPGGSLTAPKLAQVAGRMGRKAGLKVSIMDEKAIAKAGLGGILGVNRGSTLPPRLVKLTYEPEAKARGTLALVGKGITFDAGGLSIKTGTGMMTMKCDMGGAAAVLGAMQAIAAVKPAARVVAYTPLTDNMLGGDATRPGDVLTIRNGKTVEVLNTDAEGRLVLADALSLASETEPDAIVDLATLTGACMVALGPRMAGLMGNDDDWIAQVRSAADNAGERVWPLPLPDDYRKMLDSNVADLKNIGGPHAGALTAGLFLREFVGEGLRWAHLDIAGPAFGDAVVGEVPKGGSGFGVRLLVELAENFTP